MTENGTDTPRDTPTQFARKLALAHATRPGIKATQAVKLGRNAAGNVTIDVDGPALEDESLEDNYERVAAVFRKAHEDFPLSRTQIYGRDYTPNERDPKAAK